MERSRTERAALSLRSTISALNPAAMLQVGTTSLTAASSQLVRPDPLSSELLTPDALKARRQNWQLRILELADMVPEVAGAANFVENSLNLVSLRVEGGDPALGGNAATRQALQASLDSLGLGRPGKLIFLSGEAYIVWPDEQYPFSASVAEMETRTLPAQLHGPNGEREDIPQNWQYMRVWRESNTNRWQATSAHKACMDLLEAMYIHQIADAAVATSRLATAGILVWPTTAKSMGINPDTGRPFPASQEAIVEEFQKGAQQALSPKNPQAATTPFIQFMTLEGSDTFHAPTLLRLEREDQADQYETRFNSYGRRYREAVDLPAEVLSGLGETRSQGANQIREDAWRSLSPLVNLIVDALQKRLANQYGFTIKVDPSRLLEKPDNTEIIMQLLQLGQIDIAVAEKALNLPAGSLLPPPERDYSSNVVRNTPSDLKPGGNRGGGRFREQ